MDPQPKKLVVIIGAGLVGALAALYFAQDGWLVHLYEQRIDLRSQQHSKERSINLALSHRGIQALTRLKCIDMNSFLAIAIPMRGRMIHNRNGGQTSQPYGLHGECIYSIDRRVLNERLLDYADQCPSIRLFFDHEIKSLVFDYRNQQVSLSVSDRQANGNVISPDLLIGADGAYSFIRNQLSRPTQMSISQQYIDHGYLELTIPPASLDSKAAFHFNENHLHIWPRQSYMMIALPNPDMTFTCTIFAPWSILNQITTQEQVRDLFITQFSDVINLIPDFEHQFLNNPKGPLISIKCNPYHWEDKVLIIGDAAHAMVPFYGQGMNCGFEDVSVLFDTLAKYNVSPLKILPTRSSVDTKQAGALAAYSESRHKDLVAMCDLALNNYDEMRAGVANPIFLAQRWAERSISLVFPRLATPLYSMVAFTSIPYSECMRRGFKLRKLALGVLGILGLFGLVTPATILLGRRAGGWMRKYEYGLMFLK